MSTQEHYTTLVSFLLPEGLLDYFDVVDVTTKPEGLEIYLEEKNKAPEGFTDQAEKLGD